MEKLVKTNIKKLSKIKVDFSRGVPGPVMTTKSGEAHAMMILLA